MRLTLLVWLTVAFADASYAADRQVGVLAPGKFFWEPELAPSGPLVMIISLPEQTLSAYRNGIRIAYSSISSGVKGRSTPTGVFTILEKEVTHFSNKYHHAPMPYMQRLTWEGVALHGGDLPVIRQVTVVSGCRANLQKDFIQLRPAERLSLLSMRSIRIRPLPHTRVFCWLTRIRNRISPARSKPNSNGIRKEARKDRSRFWQAARTRRSTYTGTVFRLGERHLRSTIRNVHWAAMLSPCSKALPKQRAHSCLDGPHIVGWP